MHNPRATTAGSWKPAALSRRCEDARYHFSRRVCKSQNANCQPNIAGVSRRRRGRRSCGSRASGPAAFCEQPSHPPLKVSPLLTRQLHHRRRLHPRRLGPCHNRHHVRSHLLGALDDAASDMAAPAAPAVVDRDNPPVVVGDSRSRLSRRQRLRRDLRLFISQICRGLKTSTRKSELIAVLRKRRAFAACLQKTWRVSTEEGEH